MESPPYKTDDSLLGVLEELKSREPIFHRPEYGNTRTAFEAMMADCFWEIGASGRRYDREFVLQALEERRLHPENDPWETMEFHCRQLAENIYLLTYTLLQGSRTTRRATIWQRTADGWKIVFHQGTLVEDSAG